MAIFSGNVSVDGSFTTLTDLYVSMQSANNGRFHGLLNGSDYLTFTDSRVKCYNAARRP